MKNLYALLVLLALPFFAHAQLAVTISTTNASCNSVCDGAATANVTGGTPPYTYLWNPTMFTMASASNLCAGTYTVTVTDAMAATATATCTINQPPAVNITISASPMTICAGQNVMLTATGAMSYVWQPGNYTGCCYLVTPTTTTSYTCIGTDAQGCTGMAVITISVNAGPMVTVSGMDPVCNMNNGYATATVSSFFSPFVYNWSPSGGTGATEINLPAGGYTVTVADANGCTGTGTITLQDSCDYVWPGDANDDAVADNIDILDIGIANGATGTTRAGATTTWIGQPSTAWGQTLLSGTDYKWVDCDGNGTIAPVDTQAVVLNYGMTHANRYIAPSTSSTAPALSISFDQDSVGGGNTGTMTLSLGTSANPATNVYGLAFRLNYDAAQLSTPTFGFTGGTTWFGTPGSDMMRVVLHPNAAMGYVDVAITRLDHQNVSGFGTIGQIYFTATTAMNGTGNVTDVPMTITNVLLHDTAEVPQAAISVGDTVVVGDDAIILSVEQQQATSIAIYPNPAVNEINVNVPAGAQQLVTIEDVAGRTVYSHYHGAGINTISVADLPAGSYLIRVSGETTQLLNRFNIVR